MRKAIIALACFVLVCDGRRFQPQASKLPSGHRVRHLTRKGLLATALSALSLAAADPSLALGAKDKEITLAIKSYQEITCPEELSSGRMGGSMSSGASAGAGNGIAQKCVRVVADATSPIKQAVEDVGVFGNVVEQGTGSGVLGNGQDGKNDAGQFAMIKKVPPGTSEVDFIFVSQQADSCKAGKKRGDDGKVVVVTCPIEGTAPLVPLNFKSVKGIAYPGGKRYQTYNECEQNPFAEECLDEENPNP